MSRPALIVGQDYPLQVILDELFGPAEVMALPKSATFELEGLAVADLETLFRFERRPPKPYGKKGRRNRRFR